MDDIKKNSEMIIKGLEGLLAGVPENIKKLYANDPASAKNFDTSLLDPALKKVAEEMLNLKKEFNKDVN